MTNCPNRINDNQRTNDNQYRCHGCIPDTSLSWCANHHCQIRLKRQKNHWRLAVLKVPPASILKTGSSCFLATRWGVVVVSQTRLVAPHSHLCRHPCCPSSSFEWLSFCFQWLTIVIKINSEGREACWFGSGNHLSKPSPSYRKTIIFLELLYESSGILFQIGIHSYGGAVK